MLLYLVPAELQVLVWFSWFKRRFQNLCESEARSQYVSVIFASSEAICVFKKTFKHGKFSQIGWQTFHFVWFFFFAPHTAVCHRCPKNVVLFHGIFHVVSTLVPQLIIVSFHTLSVKLIEVHRLLRRNVVCNTWSKFHNRKHRYHRYYNSDDFQVKLWKNWTRAGAYVSKGCHLGSRKLLASI